MYHKGSSKSPVQSPSNMPPGLSNAPATPSMASSISKLPVMTSTARKRTTPHHQTSGTFTAAPSAKRSPRTIIHRPSLAHLAPTPNSPLATPPRRSGRLLDCYGGAAAAAAAAGTSKPKSRANVNDRIKVCVRKRPLLQGDLVDCLQADASTSQVRIFQDKTRLDGISRVNEEHSFFFDNVFDEHQDNRQVHHTSTLQSDLFDLCGAIVGVLFGRRNGHLFCLVLLLVTCPT